MKVLVIDDDDAVLMIVSHVLSSRGWEVETASDLTGGLAGADKVPDLILLDALLPDGDGMDLLRILRRNAATSKIPVIFLTGKDSDEEKAAFIEAGARGVITKPFEPLDLEEKILSIIEGT